jgi:pimeloyl-ACP methyl ester carboxylesterase
MASLGRAIVAILLVATFASTASAHCPKGATCGRVTVPLDHSGATPGTLSIAYAKLPAASFSDGTLVLIAGGPGQPAIPLTTRFADLLSTRLASYDIVAVDQRGSGGSSAVSCTVETRADVTRCATELGPARSFLTTSETAKDLEDVRRALRVEKLTLFGVSYGASVAQEYARRYPQRTAAVILDSPTPVDGLDGVDELRTFGTPRVLREVCFPGDCHRTVPDPDGALAEAIDRLPLKGTVGTSTGRRRTARATESLLYDAIAAADVSPGLRAGLPAAIASAANGDAAPLLHLADLYGDDAGTIGGVDVTRQLATSCIEARLPWAPDSPVASRADALTAFIAERAEAFAPFTPAVVLGHSLAGFCAYWPPTPKPEPAPSAAPAVPVLILSGRQDLRTPLESARRTAAMYPNATLFTVPGAGHSVLSTEPLECAASAVALFLADAPLTPCPKAGEIAGAPYAPATVGALRPTKLPGLAGRTFSAVTVTLTGVGYDTLAGAKRFAGLRGGFVRVRGGRLELRDVEWIGGVRVSGTVTEKRSTLTVDGPVDGTLRYVGDRVSGTLGGRSFG